MNGDAMIGLIGGILIFLLGLLVKMLMDLKRDMTSNDGATRKAFEDIRKELSGMVSWPDYKEDRKEVVLKLDEHGDRLLKLEIKVRVESRDGEK